MNVNNHTEEASLAQEQIEAMYLKKMAAVEKERDDLITSLKEKQVQYDKAISEYKSKLSNGTYYPTLCMDVHLKLMPAFLFFRIHV